MNKKSFETTSKEKKYQGMTLVEVMIVISIIALLSSAFTVFIRMQLFKANDAKRKAEINRIGLAVEEYEKDHDCYPSSVTCTNASSLQPYLDKIVCDPVSDDPYYYMPDDPDPNGCAKWYKIYAVLQNRFDADYQPNIGPSSLYNYVYESPNTPQ